jgi:hypothetical protein
MFMCSLNHTSGTEKRLGCVNQNLINQLELNPQINENGEKVKSMNKRKWAAVQRQLTNEKKDYCINLLKSTHVLVPRSRLYHGLIWLQVSLFYDMIIITWGTKTIIYYVFV